MRLSIKIQEPLHQIQLSDNNPISMKTPTATNQQLRKRVKVEINGFQLLLSKYK